MTATLFIFQAGMFTKNIFRIKFHKNYVFRTILQQNINVWEMNSIQICIHSKITSVHINTKLFIVSVENIKQWRYSFVKQGIQRLLFLAEKTFARVSQSMFNITMLVEVLWNSTSFAIFSRQVKCKVYQLMWYHLINQRSKHIIS